MAIRDLIAFSISGVGASRAMPSVSAIGPGDIALTRTPAGPHSMARHLVSMLMPAFAAQTCAWKTLGFTTCGAVIDISEAPGRFRYWNEARNTLNVPMRSISTTVLKRSEERRVGKERRT